MKLLVATPSAERVGGAQSILWSFLRHVDRARVDPHVVFLAEGSLEADVTALGVTTSVVPTARLRRGGSAVTAVRALRELIRRDAPDVVLAWGPKPQVYVGPACRLEGIQRRSVWRATELPQASVHKLAMVMPAAAIVCASRFVAERHERLRSRRRVLVSQPGLEPPAPVADGEVERLRARHGIRADALVVGSVGRLVPVKQHDRLLRLVATLRARGLDAQALVVGGDVRGFAPGHEGELRRLARELGLGPDAIFTGHLGSVGPALGAMDVFLTAAADEGFGASTVEALASGVPVVAVDRGGPAEIVEDGASGLLVPDASPDALVAAVSRVLTEQRLREDLSRGGLARYRERFTAEAGAERLTRVLEGIRTAA